MTATSSMIHVRLDDEMKEQAQKTLNAMGLSMSDAIRIFFRRIIEDEAMPFEIKVPNARTRAAMIEARKLAKEHHETFDNAQSLFDDLNEKIR